MSELAGSSTESEERVIAPVQIVDPLPAPVDHDVPAAEPLQGSLTQSAPIPNSDRDVALWLRRSDQAVVWFLSATLLLLLGIHWVRLSCWGISPVELSSQQPREYYYSLDINTASWVEWAQLDGIGEKLARRIVADRDEHGLFRDPADISRVKGIGPALMEKIRPFLRGGTASESAPTTP